MGQIKSKSYGGPNFLQMNSKNLIKSESSSDGRQNIPEDNGLVLNDIPLPEEIIVQILSYVTVDTLPKCLLVCKKWNEIITSPHLWRVKGSRTKKITKKNLPWYAYYALFCDDFFDKNLLLNNCGQDQLNHWKIKSNGGNGFVVEAPPCGSSSVPNEPEFNEINSCFATSFQNCSKYQIISFKNSKLHQKILNDLKPTIYVSEWYAGRFDCGCEYKLSIWLTGRKNELMVEKTIEKRVEQWEGSEWHKVESSLDKYPEGLTEIQFYHKGNDTQFWRGHYGSKMSGAVVKILWDSIAT